MRPVHVFRMSVAVLLVLAVVGVGPTPARASQKPPAGLAQQVLDLLHAKCARCHSAQAKKPRGGINYMLDLKRVAANEDIVVPGKPDESHLFLMVNENEMPPKKSGLGPLSDSQKQLIRQWIAKGAAVPEGLKPTDASEPGDGAKADQTPPAFLDHLLKWSGNLHMPLVHFPVALLICAAIAEVLGMVTKRAGFLTVVRFCLWVGFLYAVPAATFGWFRAEYGNFLAQQRTVQWHRFLGLTVVAWSLVTAVLVEIRVRRDTSGTRLVSRLALFAGAGLVAATGMFGGALVYGWDHYAW